MGCFYYALPEGVKRRENPKIEPCDGVKSVEIGGRNIKRQHLEDMGLEKDVIDKIMAENGKDIEAANGSSETLTAQIADLQQQIATRDDDLKALNQSLTAAQADAGKLTDAQTALTDLQSKYDADKQAWEQKAAQQAYD